MRIRKSTVGTLLSLMTVASAASGQTYHLTDLGTLGGGTSNASGINASGQVTGQSWTDTNNIKAFLYDGTMHDLGTLGGAFSSGDAINSSGNVTGTSQPPMGAAQHVFFHDGSIHDIGTIVGPSGAFGSGNAINDSDEIAGQASAADGKNHAFLYNGTMHDLGILGAGSVSDARGINNSGQVVGDGFLATDFSVAHAFLWNPNSANSAVGAMHDLGTLGGSFSVAYDINSGGQVVGSSTLAGDSISHAFMYDGTMHDLGIPSGFSQEEALAINDSGLIVGDLTTGSGVQRAFLRSSGITTDLNSLLDSSGTGWTLQLADGVNDAGWIVGNAITPDGDTHAFLLKPNVVPEPTMIGFMSVCGFIFQIRRKRSSPRNNAADRSTDLKPHR